MSPAAAQVHRVLLQSVPAKESTGQGKKRLMDVGPLFIANAQSAKLIQPSEGSFHYPPPSTQPAAMLGVTHREQRHDAAVTNLEGIASAS